MTLRILAYEAHVQEPDKTQKPRERHADMVPAFSWKFLLDLFTGKYLWDVSVAYRERCQKSTKAPG